MSHAFKALSICPFALDFSMLLPPPTPTEPSVYPTTHSNMTPTIHQFLLQYEAGDIITMKLLLATGVISNIAVQWLTILWWLRCYMVDFIFFPARRCNQQGPAPTHPLPPPPGDKKAFYKCCRVFRDSRLVKVSRSEIIADVWTVDAVIISLTRTTISVLMHG